MDGLSEAIDDRIFSTAGATSPAPSKRAQQKLLTNLGRYEYQTVVRPANVSNHPSPINRFGVMGGNSTLETDIYGQVSSTHLMNGIGGATTSSVTR